MLGGDVMLKGFLFVSVCVIWGTTWLAMSFVLESIPPLFATGLRFLCAAPLLVVLAMWQGASLRFPGSLWRLCLVALFYFALPFWLMILGERYISSGFAAVVFANMPIAVMAASMLILRERFSLLQYVGLLLGVLSLIGILAAETKLAGENYMVGFACLSLALLIHAVFYVMVRLHFQQVHVLSFNVLPCALAALLLLPVGWVLERPDATAFTWTSLAAVGYLGAVAGVGGIVAYFKLNQIATPVQASLCFLVFPLIALLLDGVLNNKQLSVQAAWWLPSLLLGIALSKCGTESRVMIWLESHWLFKISRSKS